MVKSLAIGKSSWWVGFVGGSLVALLVFGPGAAWSGPKSPQPVQDPPNMVDAMKNAAKFTKPGKNHETLKKFLGDWDTETKIFMGSISTPPSKGTCVGKWQMDGRWLALESKGSMMGLPFETLTTIGYDNFKMSYIQSSIQTLDTAMLCSEGDLTQDGKSLIVYGKMDEYLTGEHDKMVKQVWRFLSDDKIVLEVHDLPIGETNTKVVEITFNRRSVKP